MDFRTLRKTEGYFKDKKGTMDFRTPLKTKG